MGAHAGSGSKKAAAANKHLHDGYTHQNSLNRVA
jgi:hypothetical protein